MAKPKTNLIIKKDHAPNLLRVWMPAPAEAEESIKAIEGVVEVYHSREGYLNVWLNLCYDKEEIAAEIEAAIT